MLSQRSRTLFRSLILISVVALTQACGVFRAGTTPTVSLSVSDTPSVSSPTSYPANRTATLTASPTSAAPVATQTPFLVTVSALNGNVFIRRGPDLGFDPVGMLMNGQSETAMARDVLAKWVQISLPDQPDKTGWISIQTHYIAVMGDVMSLPEVAPTYWPVGAFLQNCTYHQMVIDPVGIILPSFDYFPDNRVRVNPGIYSIHDSEVFGNPEVLKVEIKEGSEIDVIEDGNGDKHKCPIP